MKIRILTFIISLLIGISLSAQTNLLTIAEESNFSSTGTYNDVMSFIGKLQKTYPESVRLKSIGTTTEGYDIPLMIMGKPLPDSPEEVGERIVVYLQANIHAGEVEGKESVQMVARDLLLDSTNNIWNEVVIIIVPILNIDGNEKISTKNRRNQIGPENGVGIRYNGQNLDLNRDAMKLETPEIQAVVSNILNIWDPAITVDCHTTNGSFHEEPVTFTWMQNPNGDRSLIDFMRDDMMPVVRDNLRDNYKIDNVFYGVFVDRMDYSKGWISYASEPRYLVNYIGLRNRLAILDENYAYADYKSRVLGSYGLLRTILEYAAENRTKIQDKLSNADRLTILRGELPAEKDSFAIDYQVKPTPEQITIKAFETDTIPGVKGYWRYKKSDRQVTVTVPYLADYYPVESVKYPYAYLITKPDREMINVLQLHGIKMMQLSDSVRANVQEFTFESITPSASLNQGHYVNNVKGQFTEKDMVFTEGTIVVLNGQKLGRLTSALFEPQAKDGLLKWNYFDRYLVPQWGGNYYPYPVYKLMDKTDLPISNY